MRIPIIAAFLLATAVSAPSQTMSTAPPPVASAYTGVPGDYIAQDFHFGTGETLPALKLHYLTLGTVHHNAAGHVDNAVLLLHGTGGDAHSLFNPVFSNVLFGPGQPLDITKYFLIFPDDIGHGVSAKPSDGLRMKFPHYDYDDMVRSQHQMLLEGLHIDHLRLILGTSMGCMQTFVWGETYPGFADALMPLACNAVPVAGRNRMMRYLEIENIEQDPAWQNGNYTTEPVEGLRAALELTFIMGSSAATAAEALSHARRRGEVHRQLPRSHGRRNRRQRPRLLHQRQPQLRPQPAISTASPCRSCGSTPPTTLSTRPNSVSPRSKSRRCRTPSSSSSPSRTPPAATAPTHRLPSGRIT
jgi:homoserine acetyltransferase